MWNPVLELLYGVRHPNMTSRHLTKPVSHEQYGNDSITPLPQENITDLYHLYRIKIIFIVQVAPIYHLLS